MMKSLLEVEKNRVAYHINPDKNSVHRSSLLVPKFDWCSTNITFLNHFLLKRNYKDVSLKITAIDVSGNLFDTSFFFIDEPKLKRALEINTQETLKVFADEESGILPLLSKKLESLLRENLGVLDQKITEIEIQRKPPSLSVSKEYKFMEISKLDQTVKNLIAVT